MTLKPGVFTQSTHGTKYVYSYDLDLTHNHLEQTTNNQNLALSKCHENLPKYNVQPDFWHNVARLLRFHVELQMSTG